MRTRSPKGVRIRRGAAFLLAAFLPAALALPVRGQELRKLDFVEDYLKWTPLMKDPV
ncbi:MAG: hypothetical protein HYU38_02310, partial [Candidatus Tectomicrobia bacterium]|nr:hypothetical protein [Candidatus Tectomicrobia bacterium]